MPTVGWPGRSLITFGHAGLQRDRRVRMLAGRAGEDEAIAPHQPIKRTHARTSPDSQSAEFVGEHEVRLVRPRRACGNLFDALTLAMAAQLFDRFAIQRDRRRLFAVFGSENIGTLPSTTTPPTAMHRPSPQKPNAAQAPHRDAFPSTPAAPTTAVGSSGHGPGP